MIFSKLFFKKSECASRCLTSAIGPHGGRTIRPSMAIGIGRRSTLGKGWDPGMARDERGRLTTQDDNEDGPSDQRDGQPTERRGGPRAAKPARNWVPCGHSCGHGPRRTTQRRAKSLKRLVGPPRFELGTSSTPRKRASQAALRPDHGGRSSLYREESL